MIEAQSVRMEESLLKLKLTEDDGANSFMNLLVVNCFNTLLTLFNYQTLKNDDDSNPNESTTTTSNDPNRRRVSDVLARLLRDYRNQKSVCLRSIKRDYRFINLLCLYRQAELNIEHSMSASTATSVTSKKLIVNDESLLFNHFSDSLGSMRNSLKAFIELKYEGLVDPDDEGFAEYLSEVLKKVQHAEELFVDRHPNLEFRVSWTPMMRSCLLYTSPSPRDRG